MITITSKIKHYYSLTKPRIVALMLLTTLAGMLCATNGQVTLFTICAALCGIGLTAGAAGACNQLIEVYLDKLMTRTQKRPLPSQEITLKSGWCFAIILASLGLGILYYKTNTLTMYLTFASLLGYAVIYTVFLKHLTPQNIVIGGIAGASPPLLGAAAVTNQINAAGLLLTLIIFIWTPPHFWALAIHRHQEYKNASIPMLPVTHGIAYTKLQILLYTILLYGASLLPFVIGMSSWIYLITILILNTQFLYYAVKLYRSQDNLYALPTFKYSIIYLGLLFLAVLVDHYWFLG